MMAAIAPTQDMRELDHRISDGLDIRLLWNARDNSTVVELWHRELEQVPLRFEVPPALALHAFRHPFAHLAAPPDVLLVTRRRDGRDDPDQRSLRGAPHRQ